MPFPNVRKAYKKPGVYPSHFFEARVKNLITNKRETIPIAAFNSKLAFQQASNFCYITRTKYKLIRVDKVNKIDWTAYKYLPDSWKK